MSVAAMRIVAPKDHLIRVMPQHAQEPESLAVVAQHTEDVNQVKETLSRVF